MTNQGLSWVAEGVVVFEKVFLSVFDIYESLEG